MNIQKLAQKKFIKELGEVIKRIATLARLHPEYATTIKNIWWTDSTDIISVEVPHPSRLIQVDVVQDRINFRPDTLKNYLWVKINSDEKELVSPLRFILEKMEQYHKACLAKSRIEELMPTLSKWGLLPYTSEIPGYWEGRDTEYLFIRPEEGKVYFRFPLITNTVEICFQNKKLDIDPGFLVESPVLQLRLDTISSILQKRMGEISQFLA